MHWQLLQLPADCGLRVRLIFKTNRLRLSTGVAWDWVGGVLHLRQGSTCFLT